MEMENQVTPTWQNSSGWLGMSPPHLSAPGHPQTLLQSNTTHYIPSDSRNYTSWKLPEHFQIMVKL